MTEHVTIDETSIYVAEIERLIRFHGPNVMVKIGWRREPQPLISVILSERLAENAALLAAQTLIKAGADPQVIFDEHKTIISELADKGYLTVVKYLIEEAKVPVDFAAPHLKTYTALSCALYNQDYKMTKLLLEKGAHLDIYSSQDNNLTAILVDGIISTGILYEDPEKILDTLKIIKLLQNNGFQSNEQSLKRLKDEIGNLRIADPDSDYTENLGLILKAMEESLPKANNPALIRRTAATPRLLYDELPPLSFQPESRREASVSPA